MKRMISGIKPTGKLTLGNYIGALKQFIKYQDEYEMYIFLADLHALTLPIEHDELLKNSEDILALYLACGLDPKKVVLFKQSDVAEHSELGYIMTCFSNMGELSRMTQYKDKTSSLKNDNIPTGIFIYPTLMAADILLYDADYVPVGVDQKQHVELTRDLAIRFNNRYQKEIFKLPEPLMAKQGAKIFSLSNPSKKMSKSESEKGTIYLLDDLKVTYKKIMSAVTDSSNEVYYDEVNKPGISNLLVIYSELSNQSIDEITKIYRHQGYGTFKKAVAECVVNTLKQLQEKVQEIKNSGIIKEILKQGQEKAKIVAREKVNEVYKIIGLR